MTWHLRPRRPAARCRRERYTITSGLEVTWTSLPTRWSHGFCSNLFSYEWELTKGPAGAHQWTPKSPVAANTAPHAHDTSKRVTPSMLTTDLALKMDPAYEKISRRMRAVERAATKGGHEIQVPFTPGRTDATAEQTDVAAFAVLEPTADGFRNYSAHGPECPAEHLLIGKAALLTLSAPEMVVLVGGLRVLGANHGRSSLGVFTARPETLTNGFFVTLLDMSTTWTATSAAADTFEGRDRKTGAVKWTGSRVDLLFGSNSELRALAEVYASDDAGGMFVRDFAAAWGKVMSLDRFE